MSTTQPGREATRRESELLAEVDDLRRTIAKVQKFREQYKRDHQTGLYGLIGDALGLCERRDDHSDMRACGLCSYTEYDDYWADENPLFMHDRYWIERAVVRGDLPGSALDVPEGGDGRRWANPTPSQVKAAGDE